MLEVSSDEWIERLKEIVIDEGTFVPLWIAKYTQLEEKIFITQSQMDCSCSSSYLTMQIASHMQLSKKIYRSKFFLPLLCFHRLVAQYGDEKNFYELWKKCLNSNTVGEKRRRCIIFCLLLFKFLFCGFFYIKLHNAHCS